MHKYFVKLEKPHFDPFSVPFSPNTLPKQFFKKVICVLSLYTSVTSSKKIRKFACPDF